MAFEEPDFAKVFAGHTSVITLLRYGSRPDFFSGLMDTITGKGAPSDGDDFRLSASIYLDKTITLYWENSLFISDYEKTNLRKKLMSHLREENDQIAQMLGIIFSKIAICDYPCKWPELFSDLAMRLEEGDTLTSHRTLEVLFCTIWLLFERDLGAEGMSCAKISSKLFDSCWKLWQEDAKIVLGFLNFQQLVVQELELNLTFERLLLCLNIIWRLIMFGFQGDAKSVKVPPVNSACLGFIETVSLLFENDHPKLLLSFRICVDLMRFLVAIQHWYPASFDDETVGVSLKLCLKIIAKPRYLNSPLYDQLLIECMDMVKSVLQRTSNIPSLQYKDVEELFQVLITRYFLLTEDDLKEWSQDPERFYHETQPCFVLDGFAEKVRPHAEALCQVVFQSYGELLRPVVCSILRKVTEDGPANEEDSLPKRLLREAAYTAVACVCHCFFGEFELVSNKLFEEVLCPELCNDHPNMHIIHCKIAFIVRNCAHKVGADMRKPVFRDLCELLKYDNLAVKLAACEPLGYLLERLDFQEEGSVDLLHSYWDLCLKLLVNVQDFRSKKLVLDCVLSGLLNISENIKKKSVMVKIGEGEKSVMVKIGEMITPFADKLVDEIEKAWNVSTGFTRFIALRALRLLNELGIHSPVCYKIVLSVLEICFALDASNKFDLLLYGMQLWESTLSHASLMNSQLVQLFPSLQLVVEKIFDYFPHKIDHIDDLLKVASKITCSYIKLGGITFWTAHASVIYQLRNIFYEKLNAIQKQFIGGQKRNVVIFDFAASIAPCIAPSIAAREMELNTDDIDGRGYI